MLATQYLAHPLQHSQGSSNNSKLRVSELSQEHSEANLHVSEEILNKQTYYNRFYSAGDANQANLEEEINTITGSNT